MNGKRYAPVLTGEQVSLLRTVLAVAVDDHRRHAKDAGERAGYFRDLGDAKYLQMSEESVSYNSERAASLQEIYDVIANTPERKTRVRR